MTTALSLSFIPEISDHGEIACGGFWPSRCCLPVAYDAQ